MVGLYLHIPFCSAICTYCNFNRGLFDRALKDAYLDALEQEIRTQLQQLREARRAIDHAAHPPPAAPPLSSLPRP